MKLIILEGYNDLQFFKSFLIRIMGADDKTSEEKLLVENFRRLIQSNPEMARVNILKLNKEKILLLSVGGKENFRLLAEGLRPLVNKIKREKDEIIDGILFIADEDAKVDIKHALETIKNSNLAIDADYILYDSYLEDMIIETASLIMESVNEKERKLLKYVINIIDEHFKNDKYIKKRKIAIMHAIIGPRCFGHLYDEIFQKCKKFQNLFQKLRVFGKLINWINRK